MPDNGGKLSQTTLLLRLLGGGYLMYLGISILLDRTAEPLYQAAAVLFALAGAGLLAITLPTVLRQIKGSDDSDGRGK